MKENLQPKRKALRLKNYDYSSPGAYFITMCTHNRACILSSLVGAIHESPELKLSLYGKIVDDIIRNLPEHLGARIDRYVIMPNHVHMLIIIDGDDSLRTIHESSLQGRSIISKTVGYIKMNASREIHWHCPDISVWQRAFYDHVIRDEADYIKIAKYIEENPARWQEDCFYIP